jgi:hypothetical protein
VPINHLIIFSKRLNSSFFIGCICLQNILIAQFLCRVLGIMCW